MRYLLPATTLLYSCSALAFDTYTELRFGVEDSYHKIVQHQTNGKLEGDFKGMNFGLRIGNDFGQHSVYVEYNPEQEVEIKSKDELAKVKSYFVGYRYFYTPEFFFGAQIGQSSFELVQGPNGVTFTDNPTTEGLTYGINCGYQYKIAQRYYLAADATYNIGSYKEDGPSKTAVNSIEVTSQYQVNLSAGMRF